MYDTKIKSKAIELKSLGFTQKEIATELGCGERTVRRWISGINLKNIKEDQINDIEFDFNRLSGIFSKEIIPQIMFCISMAYKNNLPNTIAFLNEIERHNLVDQNITEPWLAAISGFDLLSDITGVSKFNEIKTIIDYEKPYKNIDRKKFRRRINNLTPQLRFDLIGLLDISNFTEKDFFISKEKGNLNDYESEQIYISNLRIKGSKSEIEQFVNSKYGLLLEIESRLPDLDQQNRKMSINMYKKTPLTLILLKLFLLP